MGEFTIKDSGKRERFAGGMQRDTDEDKIKWHLVASGPMLRRWSEHLTGGAKKYDEDNWMKAAGEAEYQRFRKSAFRHFMQWYYGETCEDHASACYFNINGAEYVKERTALKPATIRPNPAKESDGRTRVYISGPMSLGDRVDNLAVAMKAMRELIGLGYAPMCPQLTFFAEPFVDASHADWVDVDIPWVRSAHAVLRLPGDSRGADREVAAAREANVPVFESVGDLHSHFLKGAQPTLKVLRDDSDDSIDGDGNIYT